MANRVALYADSTKLVRRLVAAAAAFAALGASLLLRQAFDAAVGTTVVATMVAMAGVGVALRRAKRRPVVVVDDLGIRGGDWSLRWEEVRAVQLGVASDTDPVPTLEVVATAEANRGRALGLWRRQRGERRFHIPLNDLEDTPEEVLQITQELFYANLRRRLGLPPRPQRPKRPSPFLSLPGRRDEIGKPAPP